jgi:hypothetical protein
MLMRFLFAVAVGWLSTSPLFAQSHSMIDRSRSSQTTTLFITQSVDGEYGVFEKKSRGSDLISDQTWRGYGIRNGIGIEVFKFTQFALSHTLLNMRSKESGLENLRGSRLAGEMNFVFSAPVTNIQFGFGVLASQMEYQAFDRSASFVGGGHFYSMGLNYFFTPQFSFMLTGKRLESKYSASGGSLAVESLRSQTDSLSFGLSIWI